MWCCRILDLFFVVLHLAIVLFNLFGWIWVRFRRWNLALLLLTGCSWLGLGFFYGWGYCPLTDWHFRVLGTLGEYPTETSYVAYLLNRVLGAQINENVVDMATLISYCLALLVSVLVNFNILRIKG